MTRADDNKRIDAIRRIRAGEDGVSVSRSFGHNGTWARTVLNRVLRADVAESGEPAETVRAAYRRGAS